MGIHEKIFCLWGAEERHCFRYVEAEFPGAHAGGNVSQAPRTPQKERT